jgi:predicted dehydrogenase
VSTHNDFAVFEYHGIAALKAHLGREQKPTSVSATRINHPFRRSGAVVNDAWTLATVTCSDGCTLVHHYSHHYFKGQLRQPKLLRLYGSSGSVVGDMVNFEDEAGATMPAPIQRETHQGRLHALKVMTPLGEISWQNPFAEHDFDDECIAVATSLQKMKNAVLFGGASPYSAGDGYNDMELLTAMRHSAMGGGAPVKLPLGTVRATYVALRNRLRRIDR